MIRRCVSRNTIVSERTQDMGYVTSVEDQGTYYDVINVRTFSRHASSAWPISIKLRARRLET